MTNNRRSVLPMLSIDTIARVVVNASRSAAVPSSFDTGLLLVRDANFSAAKRLKSYASASAAAAGLAADGFDDSTEAYKAAVKYFAQSPAPGKLLVSCYPSSETPARALEAVLDVTSDFYGVCLGAPETDADILALDLAISALEKPCVLFLPLTGTPAEVAAEGSLQDTLFSRSSKRVIATYAAAVSDAAAVMGCAMGLQLANASSSFALCYKTLRGVVPSDLTQSRIDAIQAKNGNVFVTRNYSFHLLEKGTTPSGYRYDEVLYMDMIAASLQAAAVALLAQNTGKLPQTDDSTAMFINRFSGILAGYTDRNVLASALWRGPAVGNIQSGAIVENGFQLWADSYDTQSEADRQAHKAMPIQVALTLSGSLESVVINVNVQL